MSNPTAAINRKLRSAREQLALLKTQPPQHAAALLEATVFHLMGAYLFLLHDIAQFCGVGGLPGIRSATTLKQRFDSHKIRCAELDELAALEESDSWLAHLCRTYRLCLGEELEEHTDSARSSPAAAAPNTVAAAQPSAVPAIAATDILASDAAPPTAAHPPLDAAQCHDWYAKLRSTIRRIQAIMVEW